MRHHLSITLWGNIFYCLLFVRNHRTRWSPQSCFSHHLSTQDETSILQECTQWLHNLVLREHWQGYDAHIALPWHKIMLQRLLVPRSFAHREITREIQDHLARLNLGGDRQWTIDYQRQTHRQHSSAEITFAAVPSKYIQQWKDELCAAQLKCVLIDVDVCAVQRLLTPDKVQLFFLQRQHEWVLVMSVNAMIVRVQSYEFDLQFFSLLQLELQWLRIWSGERIERVIFFASGEQSKQQQLEQYLQKNEIYVECYDWSPIKSSLLFQQDALPVLYALSQSSCR